MLQYSARNSPVVFTIYWSHDGVSYPDKWWVDFGAVVLSWWIGALKRLLLGSVEERLSFMDGPLALTVRREGNTLNVTAPEFSSNWITSISEIVSEITNASTLVCSKLNELGISNDEGLEQGVHSLYLLNTKISG